jgi:hypothetical protein
MPPEKRPETRPELSSAEVQDRVASQPGGEEMALRATKTGTNGDADSQSDAVAAEVPAENIRRISDPHIKPKKAG